MLGQAGQDEIKPAALLQRFLAGGGHHRPVRHRVGKGAADLNNVGPVVGQLQQVGPEISGGGEGGRDKGHFGQAALSLIVPDNGGQK